MRYVPSPVTNDDHVPPKRRWMKGKSATPEVPPSGISGVDEYREKSKPDTGFRENGEVESFRCIRGCVAVQSRNFFLIRKKGDVYPPHNNRYRFVNPGLQNKQSPMQLI